MAKTRTRLSRSGERLASLPTSDATYESVAPLLNRFLDWTQKNRAPKTYRWYRDLLRSFARHIGRRLRVVDLTAEHVEQWIETEFPEGSSSTVRSAMGAVQRSMNWAVKRKLLVSSPLVGLERPSAGRREVLVSEKDRRRIFAACPDPRIWNRHWPYYFVPNTNLR